MVSWPVLARPVTAVTLSTTMRSDALSGRACSSRVVGVRMSGAP
jgi:hypothetical protein